MQMMLTSAFWLLSAVVSVYGHGRLLEPPSRSSAWRYGFDTPVNYNDNELFCGGLQNQIAQGYKCGVCGDPWQGPRDHEAGGKKFKGTIVRRFTNPGENIEFFVQLTANHLGWFEFRLCPHDDITTPVTHACLDRYLLERLDGMGSRYYVASQEERNVTISYRLPPGVTCSQCVVQWRYHTGNSWGTDPDTGEGCAGCGYQEEFYACADIAIGGDVYVSTRQPTSSPSQDSDVSTTTTTTATTTTTTTTTTIPTTTSTSPQTTRRVTTPPAARRCYPVGEWVDRPGMDMWCDSNCRQGFCPPGMCECDLVKMKTDEGENLLKP